MSNDVNTSLVEEAWEYINSGDLSGTRLDLALEHDINTDDMEALWEHLLQARDLLREE